MPAFQHLIRYTCDTTPSGYGNAARGYLLALQTLGIDEKQVHVRPAVAWEREHRDDSDWMVKRYLDIEKPQPDKTLNIVHLHPTHLGAHWAVGWYNVALTTWETDTLPKSVYHTAALSKPRTVVEVLNECYDEIWVPTEQNRTVFVSSGVTKPIFVIPHALLPQQIPPPKDKQPEIALQHPALGNSRGDPCRFYTIGSWNARKNQQGLLEAYLRTGWNIASPVELCLHCADAGHDMLNDIAILKSAVADPSAAPSVAPVAHRKSAGWVAELHHMYHVFVTASRGEGFCLPALEALATGNLVVGSREVLKHFDWAIDRGWILPIDGEPGDIAVMPDAAGYELGQRWWSPYIGTAPEGKRGLVSALHEALGMIRAQRLPGAACAAEARQRYSAEAIGKLLENRLNEIGRVLENTGW